MAPYYVQRVLRRDRLNETGKGVDRHFSMDYMGAAEFEFGRLGEALKEMRAHVDRLQILPIKGLPHDIKTLWFLGEPEFRDQAVSLIVDQVGPRKHLLCEPTRMKNTLVPEDDLGSRYDGWWALDTNEKFLTLPYQSGGQHPWVVFVQKENAKQWLKDLRHGAKDATT